MGSVSAASVLGGVGGGAGSLGQTGSQGQRRQGCWHTLVVVHPVIVVLVIAVIVQVKLRSVSGVAGPLTCCPGAAGLQVSTHAHVSWAEQGHIRDAKQPGD